MNFFSKTIADRTERGVRQTVEEDSIVFDVLLLFTGMFLLGNIAHAYTNLQGLSCVLISDREYPSRVAFALINRVVEEFTATFPRDVWMVASGKLDFPKLKDMLQKYQDPHAADPIMRVQKELDDTKIVLVC